MLAELLDRDLKPALELVRQVRRYDAGAAARLYAYLRTDVANLISFPFDARGLYNDEVLNGEGFGEQRRCRETFHREIRDLISEGIESGAFRDLSPDFAQQAITGMTKDTITGIAIGLVSDPDHRPEEVADFVLLGLLSDPCDLPEIRAEVDAMATNAPA